MEDQQSSSKGATASAPAPLKAKEGRDAPGEAARTGEQRQQRGVVGEEGQRTLLQPWTDHRGRLNEPFLRSLTQRAVSVVIRHPGMNLALL